MKEIRKGDIMITQEDVRQKLTRLYNFINDTLAVESTVLGH